MKLINEIQAAAASSSNGLADILRKCRILASRISHPEFESWVDHELNGYFDEVPLPDYRKLAGPASGNFVGPNWHSIPNVPIPPGILKPEHRHWAETIELRDPLATLEDMIHGDEKHGFSVNWPANLIAPYARSFYQGLLRSSSGLAAS